MRATLEYRVTEYRPAMGLFCLEVAMGYYIQVMWADGYLQVIRHVEDETARRLVEELEARPDVKFVNVRKEGEPWHQV